MVIGFLYYIELKWIIVILWPCIKVHTSTVVPCVDCVWYSDRVYVYVKIYPFRTSVSLHNFGKAVIRDSSICGILICRRAFSSMIRKSIWLNHTQYYRGSLQEGVDSQRNYTNREFGVSAQGPILISARQSITWSPKRLKIYTFGGGKLWRWFYVAFLGMHLWKLFSRGKEKALQTRIRIKTVAKICEKYEILKLIAQHRHSVSYIILKTHNFHGSIQPIEKVFPAFFRAKNEFILGTEHFGYEILISSKIQGWEKLKFKLIFETFILI